MDKLKSDNNIPIKCSSYIFHSPDYQRNQRPFHWDKYIQPAGILQCKY